ncbi:MAG: hypothetical protein KDC98_11590, partial [Planctomycetes bacterium]|nr:hypothetical protein [Planctomycetota bacterium]
FGRSGSLIVNRIARWDGTSWHAFDDGISSLSGWVYTVAALPGGDVYAGGDFTKAGKASVRNIARWNGLEWSVLNGGTDAMVWSLGSLPGGGFIAGGDFTMIGGVPANHIARWDGARWSALGDGLVFTPLPLYTRVYSVAAMPNGNIVAGGTFDIAGRLSVANIAEWNGVAWSGLGAGLTNANSATTVHALLPLLNGDLLAGGAFTHSSSSSTQLNGLALWDGASWTPFHGGVSTGTIIDGAVTAIEKLANGDLVVGGYFNFAGNASARNIARWDGQQWLPLGSGVGDTVKAIVELPNGDIVIGGYFGTAGATSTRYVARWDGTSWSPLGTGMSAAVEGLAVLPNGDVLAAGLFDFAGGVYTHGLARWDGQAWHAVDAGLTGGYGGLIAESVIAADDGSIIVGGNFMLAGSHVSAFVAHLQTDCSPTVDPVATACIGPAGPITLSTITQPWVGSTCRTRATGFAPTSLAASLYGMSSPGTPLSQLSTAALPGCDLLADPISITLAFPQAGASTYDLVIPNSPALARVNLFHQFLQVEIDPLGGLASLSSSNGLRITVGQF